MAGPWWAQYRGLPGRRRCVGVRPPTSPARRFAGYIQYEMDCSPQKVRPVRLGYERINKLQHPVRQFHVLRQYDDWDLRLDLLNLRCDDRIIQRSRWHSSTIASRGRVIKSRRPSEPLQAVTSSYPFSSNRLN